MLGPRRRPRRGVWVARPGLSVVGWAGDSRALQAKARAPSFRHSQPQSQGQHTVARRGVSRTPAVRLAQADLGPHVPVFAGSSLRDPDATTHCGAAGPCLSWGMTRDRQKWSKPGVTIYLQRSEQARGGSGALGAAASEGVGRRGPGTARWAAPEEQDGCGHHLAPSTLVLSRSPPGPLRHSGRWDFRQT